MLEFSAETSELCEHFLVFLGIKQHAELAKVVFFV